jgi:tetratricopeptide (TPR) repeat protein
VFARIRQLPPGDQVQAVRADQAARWRAGRGVPVETYLDGLPGLAGDQEDVQVLVCGEVMLRRERGEAGDPAEYQRRFPTLADRLGLALGLLGVLADSGWAAQPTVAGGEKPGPGGPLATIPGYEVLGELGRGGTGVVYKARQVSLERTVALKVLLAGAHAGPEAARRFHAEAEAVARLQHPNIVQVFDHGDEAGHPFLALEYVEGGTLAGRTAGVPQAPGYAAGVVQTLAAAVQHAHGRGLVHRDLKPANVLVSADGVLKITDFGLVKWLDLAGTGGEGERTPTGALLGTPAYMSPEQAAGGREVGPATDVYALGVVLYELLVGRPPFQGDSMLEVLQRVAAETPVALRRLRSSVPRDLETICLKCLEKDPRKRYPSAAALAEDLRRFQAGESIRARPAGVVERFGRWCRRRPLVAGLSAGLVAVFLAGFGGVTHQWLAADRERQRAEEGFRKAKQAVDECFLRATEDPALQGPAMARVRKLLLETTLPYYQDFLTRRGSDPALKREAAETYARVGTINLDVGQKMDALTAFEESHRLWEELHAGSRDPAVAGGLASSLEGLARAERVLGRRNEALHNFETARDIREQFVLGAEEQTAPEPQRALAATCRSIGALHHEAGRRNEAFRFYEQARTVLDKLIAEDAWNPTLAYDLVLTTNNLGLLHRQAGHWEEALRAHQHARTLLEGQLAREPGDSRFRSELGRTWHRLAILQEEAGQWEEALAAYEQAGQIRADLVAAYPVVLEFLREWAETLDNLGDVYKEVDREAEALRSYQRSRDIWERLTASDSGDLRFRGDLAICLNNLGQLYHETSRPEEARRCYERARELLDTLIREDPGDTLFQLTLAENRYRASDLCSEPAQCAEALRCCEEARVVLEQLVQKDGADVRFRSSLADCLARTAKLYGQARQWDKALSVGAEVLRLRTALSADAPRRRDFQKRLARAWLDRAILQREAGRKDQALRYLYQARDAWERLLAANGKDSAAQSALGETLQQLGTLLEERGSLRDALAAAQAAIEHQEKAVSLAPKKAAYQQLLSKHQTSRAAMQRALGGSTDR